MILYFENSYGQMRELATVNTMKEAREHIKDFLDAHNFTSYYSRMWVRDGDIIIDVGSHTEFFHVACGSDDAAYDFMKG